MALAVAAVVVVVAVVKHVLCKLDLHSWNVDGSFFVCKLCKKRENYTLEGKRPLLVNLVDVDDWGD